MTCPKCQFANESTAKFCNRCGSAATKSANAWRWLILVFIVGGLGFWAVVFSLLAGPKADNTKETPVPDSPAPPSPATFVKTGSEARVEIVVGSDEPLLIAHDEDSFEAMNRTFRAKDKYGLGELILSGKVFPVDARTRVLVIDAGFLSHTVRVLEGTQRGKTGIIAAEFVRAP